MNPGLGLRYRIPRERFDWFLDTGAYRDSGRNTAVYAGAGIFWKPPLGRRLQPAEGLRLGGALAFFHSDTYNDGEAFVAPVPLAAYETRRVTFNMAFFPKFGTVNATSQLGFWLSIPLLDTGQ